MLDEDEGEHGVLYVANGSRPLGYKNFEALCSIGLSSKRPDEGIGHKGVGFKSVLQLSSAPELYSVVGSTSKAFDGFCFRFAGMTTSNGWRTRPRPAARRPLANCARTSRR